MPENVAVTRDNEPLILLQVDEVAKTNLAEIRTRLIERKVILPNDLFVDAKGFSVPMDEEATWPLESILADKTVKLKSSESAAAKQLASMKKDLYADQPAAPQAVLPTLPQEKKPALPVEDDKARPIESPLGKLAIRSADEVSDPVIFDREKWQKILERNNMLNGILMEGGTPSSSFRSAFSVIGGIPRFVVHDSAFISATVTHSESVHASVMSKFDKVEASASYAFASASFEASQRQSTGTTTSQSKTYAVGRWNIPRVIVQLRPENLCPDSDFVKSVSEIIDNREHSPERKYYALHRLFREYGHVWATEVILGGQLTITDSLSISSEKTEKEMEKSIRAAVGVKLGPFKASTGYGTSVQSAQMDKEFEQLKENDFEATGGDTRFAQDPGAWISTVAPAGNWRVIGRRSLMPLYMVLGEKMREEIRGILESVDHRFLPTIIEAKRPVTAKEPTRAERDGFVVARFCCNGAQATETWTVACSDGAADMQEVSFYFTGFKDANRGVNDKTLVLPVRRRHIFDVYSLDAAPRSYPAGISFHEMADMDEPYFGRAERADVLEINQPHGFMKDWTAPESGFLLLSLCENGKPSEFDVIHNNNAFARISIGIGPGRFSRTYTTCIPVLKGLPYSFMCQTEFSCGDAWFYPINPRIGRIDNPMDVAVSQVNRAECDGYLFGYVEISSGVTVATPLSGLNVKLFAGPDRLLAGQEPVAGMTMIYTSQGGIHDCLGAPVRKGDYYTLTIEGGTGLQVNNFFRFYPLVRH